MPLNDQQRRFVAEYLKDLNATQAAIRAGYSERSARNQAHRMMTNDDIASAIADGAKIATEQAGITTEWVLSGIRAIGDKEEAGDSDRLKAYELGGKYLQLWSEKHKHEHTFADLTDEQLEARKREILAKAAGQ